MLIKFESHQDCALACKLLSISVADKKILNQIADLFFKAYEELPRMMIKEIYFPKSEIKALERNIEILWDYLEKNSDSEGSKLESLVHTFSDIAYLAKEGYLQTDKLKSQIS